MSIIMMSMQKITETRRQPRPILAILVIALIYLLVVSCGDGSNDGVATEDYSGTYYVTLGTEARYTLVLNQNGKSATWTLTGGGITLSGNGTVANSTLTLTATTPLNITATLEFISNSSFQGIFELTGDSAENSPDGTITGSTTSWITYDFDTLGVPSFVDTDYIELDKIDSISLLRSSAGHDYADDFETCRNMKHYYAYKSSLGPANIVITSPVNGVIAGYTNESAGTQIGIESTTNPGIYFILFHVNLSSTFSIGDAVTKGQELGTHTETVASSDIAVGIATPSGWRLVSFLDTMTDGLFASYQERGINTRNDGIITEEARNADSLTCSGEEFTATGTLTSYFQLN